MGSGKRLRDLVVYSEKDIYIYIIYRKHQHGNRGGVQQEVFFSSICFLFLLFNDRDDVLMQNDLKLLLRKKKREMPFFLPISLPFHSFEKCSSSSSSSSYSTFKKRGRKIYEIWKILHRAPASGRLVLEESRRRRRMWSLYMRWLSQIVKSYSSKNVISLFFFFPFYLLYPISIFFIPITPTAALYTTSLHSTGSSYIYVCIYFPSELNYKKRLK